MKVAYFTSLYPPPTSPDGKGGGFVSKRIEAFGHLGHQFEVYAIVYKKTGMLDALRPSLPANDRPAIKASESSFFYRTIEVKLSVLDMLLSALTAYRHQIRKTRRAMLAQIGRVECDLVHVHWLYPVGAAALSYARYLGKPCVITCHGSDVNVVPKLPFVRRPVRQTLESADSVEFVSNALRRTAISYGYSGVNSIVIPNGINLSDIVSNEVLETATINKKSPLKPVVVGFVGNLLPVKRADKIPQIIKFIEALYGGLIEFHIIGDGKLKQKMEISLIGRNVRFFGHISHAEVLKKMRQMSVLILPSRNEGWPCVIPEAHSCGLPVVGSSKGGIPEAIADDRLIVDEIDFEARFAERVVQVLRGEIPIDKAALIERSKNYTWEALTQQTIDNYLLLLS